MSLTGYMKKVVNVVWGDRPWAQWFGGWKWD